MDLKEVYQIEMNKVDDTLHHYWYLKEDETVTDIPANALEFSSF